jgi:amino acid transporter
MKSEQLKKVINEVMDERRTKKRQEGIKLFKIIKFIIFTLMFIGTFFVMFFRLDKLTNPHLFIWVSGAFMYIWIEAMWEFLERNEGDKK